MLLFNNFSSLRRPHGLAARAVVFATALLVLTALISAATIIFGADRESEHAQLSVTSDLTTHLAKISGDMIVENDLHGMQQMVRAVASRHEVRRLAICDEQGRLIAASGGS